MFNTSVQRGWKKSVRMLANSVQRKALAKLALLCVLVISASAGAQQIPNRATLMSILGVGAPCENFEKLTFTGNLINFPAPLNSSTVILSQTNLVLPGVNYVPRLGLNMTWENTSYGGPTKRIWGNNSLGMDIVYTTPVRAMGFDFYCFTGFNISTTVKVTTVSHGVFTTTLNFTSSNTPVFFGWQDSTGITKVELIDNNGNAALSIDDHCYAFCSRQPCWNENFESYPYGVGPAPAGGWAGWNLASAANGFVTNVFSSPVKGLQVSGTTDLVHQFACVTSGKWIFHAKWYVPSNSPAGKTWIILMNDYIPNVPANQNWSAQVSANTLTGLVKWESPGQAPLLTQLPLITNRWVDVNFEIDLTANTLRITYDGDLLVSTTWKSNGTSLNQVAAVDLFCENPAAVSFFDDLCLVPDRPQNFLRGVVDNFAAPSDAAYRSPMLLAGLPTANWVNFDNFTGNRVFGTSWTGLPYMPGGIVFKADMRTRMGAHQGGSFNDVVYFGLNPIPVRPPTLAWGQTIANLPGTGGTWNSGNTPVNFLFDLANMPINGDNLLRFFNDPLYGNTFDMVTQDDTHVDYAWLRLWTCRCWWRGFPFDVIGNATAIVNDLDQMYLSMPAGEESGVSINLGEGAGSMVTFAEPVPILSAGSVLKTQMVGRINDSDGQVMALASFTGQGASSTLTVDFSPVSAPETQVTLFDSAGNVMFSQVRPNPSTLTIRSTSDSLPFTKIAGWNCLKDHDKFHTNFVLPVGVDIGPLAFTGVASLEVATHGPLNPNRGPVQAMTVTSSGRDAMLLESPGEYPWGGNSCATGIGDANIESYGGSTLVANIGGTGQDGVEWVIGQTSGYSAALAGIGDIETGDTPDGAYLELTAEGSKNGTPDSVLGKIRYTQNLGIVGVTADYSEINSSTVHLQLLRNGAILLDETHVDPNNIGGAIGRWPDTCSKGNSAIPCHRGGWWPPADFRRNGTTYVIDEARILAEPPPGLVIDYYSGLRMMASGIGQVQITSLETGNIRSGHIDLQEYGGDPSGIVAHIEVRSPGSTIVIETHDATLDASGNYSFQSNEVGNRDVSVKVWHWLRKTSNVTLPAGNSSGLNFSLANGDCDGDNEVTLADYSKLASAFGSVGDDENWDPDADLDGDGEVTLSDYSILSSHFGSAGDD